MPAATVFLVAPKSHLLGQQARGWRSNPDAADRLFKLSVVASTDSLDQRLVSECHLVGRVPDGGDRGRFTSFEPR